MGYPPSLISRGWSSQISVKSGIYLVGFCSITLIDNNTCSMAQIDAIFIATNFEEVDMVDNPDKYLCRYEFYEIIVRVAREKYLKSKVCRTLLEAVGKLLWENVFKYSDFAIPGQKWREDFLWTRVNDDLFKANMDTLKLLFSVIFSSLNI